MGVGTTSPLATIHSTKAGAEVARFTNSGSNGGDWELKIGGGGFEDRKFMVTDKFSGADNVRFSIDSSGRITKPAQPSFVAKFSGTAKDGSTINPVQFNTTSLNIGSCFNTSTYKFTAPVAGIYSFTAMPCYKESSNDFSWGFSINGGSVVADNVRVIGSTPNSHSSWTGSLIVNLAANDTVEIKFTDGTYHQNGSSLNYFSGILIG
jgi:hypothetical protein